MGLENLLKNIKESGKEWIYEQLPEMWESYDAPKHAKEEWGYDDVTWEDNPFKYGFSKFDQAVPDLASRVVNAAGELVDIGALGLESLGDLAYDVPKWTSKLGVPGPEPEGLGGIKTWWMDTVGPYNPLWLTGGKGSGMLEDAYKIQRNYTPPENYTNLGDWGMYQNWKKGSGWDTADERKIEKKTDEFMDKNSSQFAWESMWPMYLEEAKKPGNELWLERGVIDKQYDPFVNKIKDKVRKDVKDFLEFKETGKGYGQWASQKYQNEVLGDYGRYPLIEDVNFMSQNMSPWGDMPGSESIFNLANEDYINALREGKSGMTPTEFDYGLFDDDTSVGIGKEDELWADYSTKEAEDFYEDPWALAPEFVLGAGWTKIPGLAKRVGAPVKTLTSPLHDTKTGRILKEIFPGTLQWGKRDKFGIPKVKAKEGLNEQVRWLINKSLGAVDFARPKGGQFIAAATASEYMDRD